ncbi:TonB-dependent receptor [Sphingomonas sp. Sphisp140]|uniref:TonB-dependent receptor n=1 Tax=unclassified Sphingomonas TaxID=196159 RepID=UPI0039AEBF3C
MKLGAPLVPILCISGIAHAGDRQVVIDLPAGTLGQSLVLLSRQASIDIGTADPALQALHVPGVHGRMTAAEALDRLLRDSIAVAHRRGGLWRIERRPAPRRSPAPARAPSPVPEAAPPAEILVLGSKRATRLDAYPGTVAMLSPERIGLDITAQGSEALVHRLASVGTTHFGPGRNKLFVRGVIDSGFTGPSQATTGQYLNETRLTYNAPDPDLRLYDIASIEVLEGPQGTLYGAGSLGGVIHIVTARPDLDRIEGSAAAGLSSTRHGDPGGDAAAMLNLPLVPGRIGLRLVGYAELAGGYVDNVLLHKDDINGITTLGGRATLRAALGDWTVDIGGVAQTIRGDDSPWIDAADGPSVLSRATPDRLGYVDDYRLADLTLFRRWGDLSLISSTASVLQHVTEHYDAGNGGMGFLVAQRGRTTMLVNETRLSARHADGSGWLLGISLLDNRSRLGRIGAAPDGGTSPREQADNRVREATLFGEADLPLAPGLVATVGARLTIAEVKGAARAYTGPSTIPIFGDPVSVAGRHVEKRALPSLALAWKPARGLLLFARYQHGFRPGGFGISGVRGRSYDGDRIGAIEGGLRYHTPGGAFDMALSGAWTRWNDILAEVVSLGGDPVTQNIGDGEILSAEGQLGWRPHAGLRLGAGIFLNRSRLTDTRVTSVVVRGQALPNVARLGAQANLDYSTPVTASIALTFSANLRYFGGSHIGAGPLLDAAQGNYLDDRVLLRLGNVRHGISLQVTNLQDGRANRFALGTPYRIYDPQATPQQPRTVRLGFDAKF